MKALRNLLIGAVVVLVIVFIAGTFYARHLAKQQAQHTIQQIQQESNHLLNISFSGISANALSLITHTITLHHLTISSPLLPAPALLGSLQIKGAIALTSKSLPYLSLKGNDFSFASPIPGSDQKAQVHFDEMTFSYDTTETGALKNLNYGLLGLQVNNFSNLLPELAKGRLQEALHTDHKLPAQGTTQVINAEGQKAYALVAALIRPLDLSNLTLNLHLAIDAPQRLSHFAFAFKNTKTVDINMDLNLKSVYQGAIDNEDNMLAFLKASMIESSRSKAFIDYQLDPTAEKLAEIQQALAQLGYTGLHVQMQSASHYDSKTQISQNQTTYHWFDGGKLTFETKVSNLAPQPIMNAIELISNLSQLSEEADSPSQAALDSFEHSALLLSQPVYKANLDKLLLTYEDESLLPRIEKLDAKLRGTTPAEVKQQLLDALHHLANDSSMPTAIQQTFTEIANFIANPKNITLGFKPKSPVNIGKLIDQMHAAGKAHDKATQAIEAQKLPEAEKAAKRQAADQALTHAIDHLLKEAGYLSKAN